VDGKLGTVKGVEVEIIVGWSNISALTPFSARFSRSGLRHQPLMARIVSSRPGSRLAIVRYTISKKGKFPSAKWKFRRVGSGRWLLDALAGTLDPRRLHQ